MEHAHEKIEMKNNGVSYAWIAALLASALGGLFILFINTSMQSQKAINAAQATATQANTNAITALEDESVKQSALIVVVAEKVGVPTSEVNTILNSNSGN